MNRTWIRGVVAALVASVALMASIVGPNVANGAENDADYTKPLPAAEQEAAANPTSPNLGRYLRKLHRGTAHRHHAARASRSTYRSPLTGSPRTVAHALVLRHGWSETQWNCLDALWTRESSWDTYARNRSGAYGIPQALPGSKMASFGADWRTNPLTQIQWGIWYVAAAYGTPCGALAHSNSYGYY